MAVAVGDVGQQGVERGGGAGSGLVVDLGAELAQGAAHLDELAADSEQVAELAQVPRLGRGGPEVLEEAEAGEHGGIDAVVLGELADGLGEAPGAQGVDQDGLEAGLGEAEVEVAVVAAGGFEDGAGDAVMEQPVAEAAEAGRGVVELAVEAGAEDVGIELGLADIDAGDDNGGGGSHSCDPFLLRFGAAPTLPFRSRRNGCGGPTKLSYGAENPWGQDGPTRRPRRGLARPRRGPPCAGAGRGLIAAAAVAYATCGRGERGSAEAVALPLSQAHLQHKRGQQCGQFSAHPAVRPLPAPVCAPPTASLPPHSN